MWNKGLDQITDLEVEASCDVGEVGAWISGRKYSLEVVEFA
jgi:hypothetical protein